MFITFNFYFSFLPYFYPVNWKPVKILLVSFMVLATGYACAQQAAVEGFDIATDGRTVIFALTSQGRSTVNLLDIEAKTSRRLLTAEQGYTFTRPRFFGGNNFTVIKSQGLSAELFLASLSGKAPTEIASGEMITEAMGLENRNKVYFFKANEYTKYSSMVQKAPHNMDLYSIDVETREFKRVTYMKAYRLFEMALSKSGDIYFRWENADSSGVYSLQLDACCVLKKFRPKSPDPNMVYHATLSEEHKKFFFSAMYFIYEYNPRKNQGIQIHSSPGPIDRLAVNPQKDEVIFSARADSRLFFIDFDGNAKDTIDCAGVIEN